MPLTVLTNLLLRPEGRHRPRLERVHRLRPTKAVQVHGQKVEGHAGSRFRNLLEKLGLTALNTIDKFQPTFFPTAGQGMRTGIDFLVAPLSFLMVLGHCQTAKHLGKSTQSSPPVHRGTGSWQI